MSLGGTLWPAHAKAVLLICCKFQDLNLSSMKQNLPFCGAGTSLLNASALWWGWELGEDRKHRFPVNPFEDPQWKEALLLMLEF